VELVIGRLGDDEDSGGQAAGAAAPKPRTAKIGVRAQAAAAADKAALAEVADAAPDGDGGDDGDDEPGPAAASIGAGFPVPIGLVKYRIAMPTNGSDGNLIMQEKTVVSGTTAAGGTRTWTVLNCATSETSIVSNDHLMDCIKNQCSGTGAQRPPRRTTPSLKLSTAPDPGDGWAYSSNFTGQIGVATIPDPGGAKTKSGKSVQQIKVSYVIAAAQSVGGEWAQLYATCDASADQGLYLTLVQHGAGILAMLNLSKGGGDKRTPAILRRAKILTHEQRQGSASDSGSLHVPFNPEIFEQVLVDVGAAAAAAGGVVNFLAARGCVKGSLPPKSVEDEMRAVYCYILSAMNALKPGAPLLFAIIESLLRANIPPLSPRPKIIRQRIHMLYNGMLGQLLKDTAKRQILPPGSGRAGLSEDAAKRDTARKMETALRLESIRSAKRVAENSRSSQPSIAAISNKFLQLNPKAGSPADPLPPFALAEYRQSCWSATGADGAPPPDYTEPTRNRAELEMPESDPSTAIQITKVELLAQRSRLDVTKATGLCATSNAQLKIILSVDDMVSEELLTLSNRYLRGETTDEERLIHAAGRGVGAGKPKSTSSDDARPLVCTNAFARLLSRCLLAKVMTPLNDYFLNSSDSCKQFAFCPGGTELNYAAVSAHLELNPGDVCVSTDMKAAFNMFDRKCMFEQLKRVPGLDGMIPYVALVYGQAATVHVDRGAEFGPLLIASEVGGKQGCGLAMALFCLAHFPSMLASTSRHPGTACYGFADDAKNLGKIDSALAATVTYITDYEINTCGPMNVSKSEIYAPGKSMAVVCASLETSGLPSLPVSLEGTVITGGPIGTDEFVAAYVRGLVEKKLEMIPFMMCFENIQNQFAFLSQALGPNFVHLARLIDCSPGTPAGIELYRWDTSLMGALSKITGQPLSHQARQLARIPKRNGGLGLSLTADFAAPAFIAGKLLSASKLSSISPQLAQAFGGLCNRATPIHYATERAVFEVTHALSLTSEGIGVIMDAYGDLSKEIKHSHRLQSKLSQCIGDIKFADLRPDLSLRSKALVHSFAGDPHSLSCVSHRSPLTTFSNTEFSIFINRRLLQNIQPFTGSHGGLRCDGCGKSGCEKGFGDSLLSCNSLAHITRFIHDPIKEVIASIGRASGVRVAVEPASVSRQDRRRTDLKFSGLLADGGQLYADVTVTNPTCASYVHDAAVVPGATAAKAAVSKVDWHGAAVASSGPGNIFIPLAIEMGGRLDPPAEALVDALIRAGTPDRRMWSPFKTFWMRAIAVATQKGVARVISRPRLPQPPLLLPSNGNPAPPSAANLARLAHMTSVNDQTNDHVHVEPMNDQDPFHTTRSPQPSAAPVGNDAHMRS